MAGSNIYLDIAERTGGDIYIGVVGPVRTGKSTFIKKFLENMVIPNIEDVYSRERAIDELPQSGSGRTIMTAEPKFIPEDGVNISLGDGAGCRVRLVDSVGYMVAGASGNMEDGLERRVMTPWYDHEIPMSQAAEEGTHRVITEHSSIGIMVTTDGSICGIPREDYAVAEARVAAELNKIGKPYVILLNCSNPGSEEAAELASQLSQEYGRDCIPVNCSELDERMLREIMKAVLFEFPVGSLCVYMPAWTDALSTDNELKSSLYEMMMSSVSEIKRVGDIDKVLSAISENDAVGEACVTSIDLGTGRIEITINLKQQLYYQIISAESGFEIKNDKDLLVLLHSMSGLKSEYERVHDALKSVRETGYGIVMPTIEEMTLEEPQIVRQGGRYGVRLKASAPSIHMVMANIETEVSPAIGGEKASEEVINFLLQGYDGDINRIWESNIFGKSLNDIAGEGLTNKIKAMPLDAQNKLQNTIQRIINEGSGGLICIIL